MNFYFEKVDIGSGVIMDRFYLMKNDSEARKHGLLKSKVQTVFKNDEEMMKIAEMNRRWLLRYEIS